MEAWEDSSTSSLPQASTSNGRDEVKEIKKEAQKDTLRVHMWRFLTALALFATAAAVTLITFFLLKAEEERAFETAVSKITRNASSPSSFSAF